MFQEKGRNVFINEIINTFFILRDKEANLYSFPVENIRLLFTFFFCGKQFSFNI